MKRYFNVLVVLVMLIAAISGCSSGKFAAGTRDSKGMNSEGTEHKGVLPAIEISKSSNFEPDGGISLSTAQEGVTRYLEERGMKGDIRQTIKLSEITVKEAWENNGVQIYLVDVDYAWLHGVAVIKAGKVLCVLDGMPANNIFLADLDSDGYYEVYTNVSFGSGIVSAEIRGYNIASGTAYFLSKRMKNDLFLFIRDKALWIKEYKYSSSMAAGDEPLTIRKLDIKDFAPDSKDKRTQNIAEGKKIQIFLPKLKDYYNSAYEHWKELNIDTIPLMEKPLIEAEDILSMDAGNITLKKNLIVVTGQGMDTGLIFDDKKEKTLNFEYNGENYSINSNSPELFYSYDIHGVCIVERGDNIFLVKQREYKRNEGNNQQVLERKYKKGPVGVPYVLVVDGERTELGVLQVEEGEFAVPEPMDSWCYMGFQDNLPRIVPGGNVLKREK